MWWFMVIWLFFLFVWSRCWSGSGLMFCLLNCCIIVVMRSVRRLRFFLSSLRCILFVCWLVMKILSCFVILILVMSWMILICVVGVLVLWKVCFFVRKFGLSRLRRKLVSCCCLLWLVLVCLMSSLSLMRLFVIVIWWMIWLCRFLICWLICFCFVRCWKKSLFCLSCVCIKECCGGVVGNLFECLCLGVL